MRATLGRCLSGVMFCALVYVPAHTGAQAPEATATEPAAPPASEAAAKQERPSEAVGNEAAANEVPSEAAAQVANGETVNDGKSIQIAGKKLDALAVACLFGFAFGAFLTFARILVHLRRQMLGRA